MILGSKKAGTEPDSFDTKKSSFSLTTCILINSQKR